ncbi:MarR family winged helix-turn-helix transcriptional regulator [Streptomyces sp. NPDC101234]|uniref:MarR family winged helix-turn-helix transcriptional regulator n=1 Tax=Streptomyces sp. NPDC101234 TaxID=3366138 RepID=UPI0038079A30
MDAPKEPRWLDDEEDQAWIALSSMLMRLPAALDAQLQGDAGLSLFEYQVMAALSMAEDRSMRMSELAAFVEGSLPRLSQVVGRLEKRDWARRSTDPSDGRYTVATLTDDGWDKVTTAAPGHVEAVRTYVFDSLTRAQVRQLTAVGRRIVGAIDPGHPLVTGAVDKVRRKK